MTEIKNNSSKTLCTVAVLTTFVCYFAERLFEIFATPNSQNTIIVAMVFTVALGLVFFINTKITNPFYSLLAAVIGFKMMPPVIYPLAVESTEGDLIYTIVRAVALALFAILVVKTYRLQPKDDKVAVVPVVLVIVAVPFFNDLGTAIANDLQLIFETKLYSYFAEAVCYILAGVVIFISAYKSNYQSAKFVSYFQFVALALNTIRRVAAIIVNVVNGTHISRSYYMWIAVYIVLFVLFAYLLKAMKNKK